MTNERDTQTLTGDERYELASAAQSAERRNKPAALVVFAGVLFVIACAMLGVAIAQGASARDSLRDEKNDLKKVQDLAIQHQRLSLRLNAGVSDDDVCSEIPTLLTQVEQLAKRAKLAKPIGFPDDRSERKQSNIRLRKMNYSVRDPSLENLTSWVMSVVDTVPCMRIYTFDLKPSGTTEWQLDVGFERYERAGR